MEKEPSIIECKNLSKEFKLVGRDEKVQALKGVSLCEGDEFYGIKKGEFVIIRGPSGGGKTTLLNMLGTIDSPSEGEIYILNKQINKKSSDVFLSKLRLEYIGFVFQSFNLIATMTALENVELPMKIHNKLSSKESKKKAT